MVFVQFFFLFFVTDISEILKKVIFFVMKVDNMSNFKTQLILKLLPTKYYTHCDYHPKKEKVKKGYHVVISFDSLHTLPISYNQII